MKLVAGNLYRWKLFSILTVGCAVGLGVWVEIQQNKSHSLPQTAVACALFGLIGAMSILFRERRLQILVFGKIYEPQVWKIAPIALVVGGWLLDFRHGLVFNHQYAHYSAFAVGALFGMGKLLMVVGVTLPAVVTFRASPKPKAANRKRPVLNLKVLIRELVLALNNTHDMTERQRQFVEENLINAVEALCRIDRHHKAARLCGKVPTLIKFSNALEGLDIEDGLKIASEAYKRDDWGTALKLLDWALLTKPSDSWRRRIHATAKIVAEQVSQSDDTFAAKVIALQLSAPLTTLLKNSSEQSPDSRRWA